MSLGVLGVSRKSLDLTDDEDLGLPKSLQNSPGKLKSLKFKHMGYLEICRMATLNVTVANLSPSLMFKKNYFSSLYIN